MKNPMPWLVKSFIAFFAIVSVPHGVSQTSQIGDFTAGKAYFQQSCVVCHADALGADNTPIVKQGPSLVGVFGRPAGSSPNFNYSRALSESGIVWDETSLDHFLSGPMALVPGTTMPIQISSPVDRHNIIAYLETLKMSPGVVAVPEATPQKQVISTDPNDWNHATPGLQHHFSVADLPTPFSTTSSGNGPKVVKQPPGAKLSVPEGFQVQEFASGFVNPRLVRVAPNGDIFITETGANRIRVLRAADGADKPSENQIFAEGLDHPFGIAFYPAGSEPQWIYLANNNSVVRIPYHSGDLKAAGTPEVIVPRITQSGGGHGMRDIAFSKDGRRLFISVGSGSNIAEHLSKKSSAEIQQWEADHGRGAAWDSEANRADILVTDPEGKQPLHTFATGIRNGSVLSVNQETGDLWTSVNERDGLGDNLVPDYITRVKEGGFYGWPWYYMGGHEDPRHAGERPDLAGLTIVPDVLLQSHSATLGTVFYPSSNGSAAFPPEYQGEMFAAFHGSWNRSIRTGYKVVRVRLKNGIATGEYDDFLTGFVLDDRSVWGRPVGVAVAHDGSLLVTEDGNGTLWRISPVGH